MNNQNVYIYIYICIHMYTYIYKYMCVYVMGKHIYDDGHADISSDHTI